MEIAIAVGLLLAGGECAAVGVFLLATARSPQVTRRSRRFFAAVGVVAVAFGLALVAVAGIIGGIAWTR